MIALFATLDAVLLTRLADTVLTAAGIFAAVVVAAHFREALRK